MKRKVIKRFILNAIFLLAITITFTACDEELRTAPLIKKTNTLAKGTGIQNGDIIVVISKSVSQPYWVPIHAGAIKAQNDLKKQGLDIQIQWKGPPALDDFNGQIKIFEDAIKNPKVKGVSIAPCHSVLLIDIIKKSNQKNIPVNLFDTGLDVSQATPGVDYLAYTGPNSYDSGVNAAKTLADLINNKGTVVIFNPFINSGPSEERRRGFIEEIDLHHKQIKIRFRDARPKDATVQAALNQFEELLPKMKDVQGIFCINTYMSEGVAQAVEKHKLKNKYKIIAVDATPKLIKALQNENVDVLLKQIQFNMGYHSVMNLVYHLQGKKVAQRHYTNAIFVTRQNMKQPEIQDALYPPIDKYLK